MRGLGVLFVFGVILLLFAVNMAPEAAMAGDSAGVAYPMTGFLSGVLFPLLFAVLVVLACWAVIWVARFLKMEVLLNGQVHTQRLVMTAVEFAEERAAKMVKHFGLEISGHEKLNMAVKRILESEPKLNRKKAEELVEAALSRLQGFGATGKNAW